MTPHVQLFPKSTCCIDEVPSTVFIGDAEAHRIAYIRWLQPLTARSSTSGLRTTPVLGGPEERHGRHGTTKPTTDMRAFTRRSQTPPRDPMDWGASWQHRPKWNSPGRRRPGHGCAAPNKPTKQPPRSWNASWDDSWRTHEVIYQPWSSRANCAGEEPTPSPKP